MKTMLAAGVVMAAVGGARGEVIRALVITGHNNHNWAYTSRVHAETLEATGRFAVTITEDFPALVAGMSGGERYGVIVLDYNDIHEPKRWGDRAERWLIEAVREGTGVVAIHSANNAFNGWAEYEEMLGLLWREGAGHGDVHRFTVEIEDRGHEVTRGLEDFQTHDELYHRLTNPRGTEYRLLARALDRKEVRGTGEREPMALVSTYGKGRVFATPLGHVWTNTGAAKPEVQATKGSVLNEGFRTLMTRGAEWAATGRVTIDRWSDRREHNVLTEAERQAGWVSLFDGKAAGSWRGFRREGFPAKGWSVREGMLVHERGGGGGDLCTVEEYGDFEFECEWRVEAGGNSGIMYRASEEEEYPWQTGREMQVLDDAGHADGQKAKTRAGTMYDIVACAADVSRPAGHWNRARVVCRGTVIEHWLNGVRVVSIDTAGREYAAALAESKFPRMNLSRFGVPTRGRIVLQDHGDEVAFRNLRVRELK